MNANWLHHQKLRCGPNGARTRVRVAHGRFLPEPVDRCGWTQRMTDQGGRGSVRGDSGRPGFSLVELLIVLLVVSVLSVLAVPNIVIVKYRVDGAARGAVAALVSAQRQAVVRHVNDVPSGIGKVNNTFTGRPDPSGIDGHGSGTSRWDIPPANKAVVVPRISQDPGTAP